MSHPTVPLIESFYEARNRRDIEGAMTLLHPEVEWDTSGRLIEPDIYRGHAAVERAMRDIGETWEVIEWTPVEYLSVDDDTVVTVVRVRGRGRVSGAPVDTTIAYAVSQREGKIGKLVYYGNKATALEAAGLSE